MALAAFSARLSLPLLATVGPLAPGLGDASAAPAGLGAGSGRRRRRAWSVGVTYAITKVAGLSSTFARSTEAEVEGLDMHVHGERALARHRLGTPTARRLAQRCAIGRFAAVGAAASDTRMANPVVAADAAAEVHQLALDPVDLAAASIRPPARNSRRRDRAAVRAASAPRRRWPRDHPAVRMPARPAGSPGRPRGGKR